MYALLLTVVLLNPNDTAPCIVNGLGMIPAWGTLRLLVSQDAPLTGPAETESAASIFVEQLLGHTIVSQMVPFWWIMKAVVVLWFLMGTGEHEMPGVEVSACYMPSTSCGSTRLTETDGDLARAGIDSEMQYLGDEQLHRRLSRTWTSVPQERPDDSRPRFAVSEQAGRVQAG
jgi:hypothetical protein